MLKVDYFRRRVPDRFFFFLVTADRWVRVNKYRKHVFVCTSYDCSSFGSEEIQELLHKGIQQRQLNDVKLTKSGCLKECEDGPIVVIYPDGVWYSRVLPEDVDEIIDSHLVEGRIVSRLLHYKME
jgi:(2Fe-2S) ferredoxin